MANTKNAKPRRKITAKKTQTPKTTKTAKVSTAKADKPTVPMHSLSSKWDGPSDVANSRASRTSIDYSKFGSLPNAKMTDRDRKAYAALESEFGKRQFERANVDAGILKRLGERGYIAHVDGAANDPLARFKLTGKKLAA